MAPARSRHERRFVLPVSAERYWAIRSSEKFQDWLADREGFERTTTSLTERILGSGRRELTQSERVVCKVASHGPAQAVAFPPAAPCPCG